MRISSFFETWSRPLIQRLLIQFCGESHLNHVFLVLGCHLLIILDFKGFKQI